ncbi:GtrA family protein [Candidatus Collinsella stercoripullorum]|uniref:GtrA family protein n=1 Tax=Candidatus Collinsella stercoripullorum TaxID=2838522 RepID=UPI001C3984D9|nr:GtrA family protein [Candidatus Collinsella stercoripullorum]HJA00199.1 GtrA family protein [Candidatus Collinsella stercoripullorum]
MRAALSKDTVKQFSKFAVVGITSLAVDYILLLVLVELLHVDFLIATSASFLASVVVNYFLSMRYVFSRRDDLSRKREFTIFAVLSAVGLGLNDLFMFVGVAVLSIGYQVMKLISTFMVTWYNFFSRRRFLDGGHA